MNLPEGALGVTSRAGKKHIIMLDMDGLRDEDANFTAFKIVREHNLSHMHGLRTKRGWHFVSFDMLTWNQVKRIMIASDEDERHHSIISDHAVLRISGKYEEGWCRMSLPPKYMFTVKGNNNKPQTSNLHAELYNQLFNVPFVNNAINVGNIELVTYWTGCE